MIIKEIDSRRQHFLLIRHRHIRQIRLHRHHRIIDLIVVRQFK